MSYMNCIEFDINVIPEKRFMLDRALTDLRKEMGDSICRWSDLQIEDEVVNNDLITNKDGKFYLGFESEDYYRNFYVEDGQTMAFFLKNYVEEGKILFIDEEGERWGFVFDGCGNVYDLEVRIIYEKGEKLNE